MHLFSENAHNNILRVKKQCEFSLLKDLNLELGTSYSTYSPLMCSIGKWNEFHRENLFEILPSQKLFKFITDSKLLSKLEEILTSNDSTTPLDYIVDKENSSICFTNNNNSIQETEFINLISSASDIINRSDPLLFSLYSRMISYIFPIFHTSGENSFTAFSTYRMMDSIFISPNIYSSQYPEIDYGIHLIHELGHQILYIWQTYDPLILNSHNTSAYSGVRKTYRPALASLHSAVALDFMLKLCHSMQNSNIFLSTENKYVAHKIEEFSPSLKQNLDSILECCSLTQKGRSILSEIFLLINNNTNLTFQYRNAL
ncbi:HEXXH motif-containing putative peptide modification protein [Fluviispira multicolorata]|uniref:HEXXH motif-containing protein n=1 Tax=Fluviispira multicolorata TaxID=2654512 RepID=A0A833JHU1_9BACT|nr:HEXXH motif-containing putative peptide modification protein [Fluviispira multicolorata]KAB8033642.1 hypothetical protein GCL57_02740 [Fluviispira multicolorata]